MPLPYGILPQTQESLSHILHHYFKYKEDRERRQLPSRPMVVGLSGCQGSGKTTLSDTVVHLLKESPYQLNVVNFSMDDVYLTRIEQVKLTQKYPTNPFYQHRGQAGSHDLDLLQHTLDALTEKGTVAIPAYDKSMHEGQGDRVDREEWRRVRAPVDIVLLEGWMLGFKPLEEDGLVETYHELNLVYKGVTLEDVRVMNGRLREYEDRIYPYFDIFIHLSPLQLQQVYEWRLQQEHHMKSTRGVGGLSDERVRTFVDSYMPAYQLYLPSLDKVGFYSQCRNTLKPYEGLNRMDRGYSGPERHLKMTLDEERKVVSIERMKETVIIVNKKGIVTGRMMIVCVCIAVIGIVGYNKRGKITQIIKHILQ